MPIEHRANQAVGGGAGGLCGVLRDDRGSGARTRSPAPDRGRHL